MEKITEFLNTFSLEKYVPKLDTLMGWVQWLVSLAVRVGPVCILVLGLIYLLSPPKEANWKAGYRTYFGMGSVLAWQFTQRLAGLLMTPVGLILTVLAYLKVGSFPDMDLMHMAQSAFGAIKGQLICALLIYILIFAATAVLFDRKGSCRFGGQAEELICKIVPKWVAEPRSASPEPELPQELSFEGQPLRAEDITIENL